jgi:glycogen debranching enzyme
MIECLNRTSKFILLWALVGLLSAATLAQERVLIGAYDVAHFNGLVFIANEENFFGLRFLVYRQGESLEDAPSAQRIAELGPQAPDGSYARIRWQSHLKDQGVITLRWSRINQRVVVGRLTVPAGVRVALEVYRPWDHTRNEKTWANFIVQDDKRTILGETLHHKSYKPALRRFLVRTDREAAGAASYNDITEMRQSLVKNGHAYPIFTHYIAGYGLNSHSVLSFETAENPALGFVALVGDEIEAMGREADALLQKSIPELLDQAEKQYEARRVASGGFIGEAVEAINRALQWNLLYIPERRIEYIAAARDRSRGPWGFVSHWDSFFLGLMMALTDPQRASSSIRAILEAQTPDGRIPSGYGLQDHPQNEAPLLAGRSMPPIGALVTWKVYLATQDLELLVASYPHLKQWSEWWFANRGDGQAWRDGNGDGLLEWGYDAELEYGELGARALPNAAKALNAYYETGLDDSPQWSGETDRQDESGQNQPPNRVKYNEKTHTLELTPVGLNALYALDAEILMLIARELGLNADAAKFEARAQRIKQLINEKLWSEEDGLYLNRYWDGRFSRRLTPEIFYPLLAGIPDEARARRMVSTLLDTKKFWGEYVLPSVARDDPAFLEQRYWRGRIWSPMNYLVYVGLKRYGFNAEATELARKTTALARTAWERDGKLYESYSGLDGRGGYGQSGSSVASFGSLMHLLGIEEVFSADPWSGPTIGSPTAIDEARLERVRFGADSYDFIAGPERTSVRRNGQLEIEFAGAVRLRAYRANERAITFTIETASEVRGRVPAVDARSLAVMIDEKIAVRSAPGEEAVFKVKAGAHRLIILK